MAPEVTLAIPDDALPYLQIQRGAIANLQSDRNAWTEAYLKSLEFDFAVIKPSLPASADRILDIGSGMAGIDILLAKHFRQPEVWLLDGDDDHPVMVRHAQTFNDMGVARRFLTVNGVFSIVTMSPALELAPAPCDLIISLQSWCFHYNPETYLDYVRASTRPGTVLILDVRSDYRTWRNALRAAFREVDVIYVGRKFERVLFRA